MQSSRKQGSTASICKKMDICCDYVKIAGVLCAIMYCVEEKKKPSQAPEAQRMDDYSAQEYQRFEDEDERQDRGACKSFCC